MTSTYLIWATGRNSIWSGASEPHHVVLALKNAKRKGQPIKVWYLTVDGDYLLIPDPEDHFDVEY